MPGLCREAGVVVGQCGIEESATGSSFYCSSEYFEVLGQISSRNTEAVFSPSVPWSRPHYYASLKRHWEAR